MLRGRRDECAVLDQLLQRVRVGESSVLVVRGEAGIGKTALLEYVAEQSTGCRVARAVGVQAEMELAFAGLHHLCAPMLDGIRALPEPQRDALAVAFGLQEGTAPDRFLVALATLSLLAEVAETSPLVCLIEDAQWLDRASAQALAFVGRRVLAERIAIVFAVREPSEVHELAGLPELRLQGLDGADARSLLESVVPGRVDARVRERILGETRGNPLALLELPRGMSPAELAGGFGLPDARPLANRIEQTFLERVRALPRDTQRLLLAAAAEPLGDSGLLWGAAERLGIGGDAREPAEAAELIEFGLHVRFKHLGPFRRLPGGGSAGPVRGPPGAFRIDRSSRRSRPARLASRARDAAAGRGGGGRNGALGRACTPPRRIGGVRRVPRARGRADARAGAPRSPGAGRRAGEARCRRFRRRRRAALGGQARPARRAAARATGTGGCGDRVQPRTRARRAAAAARGVEAARASRCRDGSRDLPRGAGIGDLRRAPRHRPERAGSGRGRARVEPRAVARSCGGTAGRACDQVHRGIRGVRRAAVRGRARVRWTRRRRSRPALALAGVPAGTGSVGRRALVRAGDPRREPRARDGRAQPAGGDGELPRRLPHPRGGLRHGRRADRGGRRDHAGDRDPAAEVRRRPADRCPWRPGFVAGVLRVGAGEPDRTRRGLRSRHPRVAQGLDVQRQRPLRPGARAGPAGLRVRGRARVWPQPGRADRGRRARWSIR